MWKKNRNGQRIAQWAISAMAVVAFAILLFFCLYKFDTLKSLIRKITLSLQPVIIGLVIAYLLNPIMNYVEKIFFKVFQRSGEPSARMKRSARTVGILFSITFMIAVVVLLMFMLIPELITSITNLVNQIPGKTEDFLNFLNAEFEKHGEWILANDTISQKLDDLITGITDFAVDWAKNDLLGTVNKVASSLTTGVVVVVKFFVNLVVGIVVSIYLLASKEKLIGMFKKMIYALNPSERANGIIDTLRQTHRIFGGFITGKILDSLIIGVLCFIGVTVMGMPYPLLLSVVIGVTNVIPFFGPYIGAVPTTLLVLLYNPIQGLIFVIFILVLQQIDGNIIGPKILGDSTGLSSFWVIFAILFAGGMFGMLGMLIGVPSFAVIYYLVKQQIEGRLAEKKLPVETACYETVDRVETSTGQIIHSERKEERRRPRKWKFRKDEKDWKDTDDAGDKDPAEEDETSLK